MVQPLNVIGQFREGKGGEIDLWGGGGSGTLRVSRDGGSSWQKDPLGASQPTNFTRFVFPGDGKGFVLGERGSLLRWVG